MSDMINGIGVRGPSTYGVGAARAVGSPAAAQAPGTTQETAPALSTEGFAPSSEAQETQQDTQAGEARASQIFSAWAPPPAAPGASAGQLDIQGLENTAVNQVHGVQNGQHVGMQGPESGFSQATVYSSRPPV
jgi:nucleoid-associated protein YgaU